MNAYPEYKASGIDWLGEIPSHWMVAPIKTLLAKSSSGVWGEEANEDGNDVVCFRVADFDYPHLCLKYNNITYRSIAPAQMQGREVEYGDIVIEKSGGGDLNPVGRAVISTFEGLATCSNFMHVISANGRAINSFLNYLLATIYCKGLNRLYFAQTTGIQNLNIKEYLAQRIALPSLDEQTKIAAYLDDVTGKIDTLISEKRKQVEDIRAYRTSLITETVTRGLNPDAPLRPSGIDWLGDIPKHWAIIKIKYVSDLYSGSNVTSEDIKDNGYPVFGGNGLRGYFDKYNHDGDYVLIGRQGALCGNINYAHGKFWATEHAVVCHPIKNYNWFWFGELLRIMNLNQYSLASAQPGLSVERIKNLSIPVPPLAEQQEIADFLDAKTAKIDAMIEELEVQLNELAEYKQAVITEAVTGKVDVRDYKPSN